MTAFQSSEAASPQTPSAKIDCGLACPPSRKAEQILAGARSAFNDLGYEGTSVDEIARRAGVSKPTVYNHFADKQALFAASFTRQCHDEGLRAFEEGSTGAEPGACVEAGLRRFAHYFVRHRLSPSAQSSFRIAVAESQRFPELGRNYYDSGLGLGALRISQLLTEAVERGDLEIDDVDLAAHHFIQLCTADAFYKRLFFVTENVTDADIARIADGAAWVFFRAYRKEPATGEPASRQADSPAQPLTS